MTIALDTLGLIRLMTWLSPAFPVGGFAYSGGLEKAVEDGLIDGGGTATGRQEALLAWLTSLLDHGAIWNDAVLLAEAWRVWNMPQVLSEVSDLALALAGSRERYQETTALGAAFRDAARSWADPFSAQPSGPVAYPVAVGAVGANQGIGCEAVLAAYLHAALSQQVSAGIRLSLIGQTGGLAILSRLEAPVASLAARAFQSGLDDLGSATIAADIVSARHEGQAVRLFRS
ncbi:urease accessory protein UreF [Agrobacterium vitis]|uniref:urease accessory protein UreF n=1 Tax=Agrobacterium vitis TaxID=373 RepID=UPI0012E74DD5|nr:urease accessory protein UreF [Agrobacterium vitis]MVA71985.1 urease accessory protein UreF [Agrobacterium vitis]BCH63573.1 urease accessory protein UreF [Agrobacterium vitis]